MITREGANMIEQLSPLIADIDIGIDLDLDVKTLKH